jgi:hypothetical protein
MARSELAHKLLDKLQHDLLDQMTRDLLAELASDEITGDLLRYSTDKGDLVAELVDALEDPEDEEELYRTVTDLWLELKFEWARYNQVMQYQLARKGEAQTKVIARGSVCSNIIRELEELLRPRDIASLTKFVASPLAD